MNPDSGQHSFSWQCGTEKGSGLDVPSARTNLTKGLLIVVFWFTDSQLIFLSVHHCFRRTPLDLCLDGVDALQEPRLARSTVLKLTCASYGARILFWFKLSKATTMSH